MAKKQKTSDDNKYFKGRDNMPMHGAVFEYTPEQISEILKCKNDIMHFATNYFYIISEEGRHNIELFPKQVEVLKGFVDNRFTVLLSSRQTSKSTLMTIYCLWYALFNDDKLVCYAANKESTAMELLQRIKTAYEELPNWLKCPLKANNEKSMLFSNGSKILTAATAIDSFRGLSISCLCLDEFAFVDPGIASAFFNSVMPAITSFKKSKVIMVSTPNGAEGLFYETYTKALRRKEGDEGWRAMEMHWTHFPGRDAKWKAGVMGVLNGDETRWAQEFDNVFLDIGQSAMNMALIKRWINICQGIKPVLLQYGDSFKIYKKHDPKRTYVFGVDTSKGLGQDAHVIQVIDITDIDRMEQVAVFRNNSIPINVFTNTLFSLLEDWGSPFVMIENFGPGEACIELLKNLYNYPKVVNYKRPDKSVQPDFYSENGINTKNNTKIEALNNFKYYFEYLNNFIFNDLETIIEFQTFKRLANDSYRATGGHTDDLVMAMLWALYILEKDLAEHYLTVTSYDESGKVQGILHNSNKGGLESFIIEKQFEQNSIYTNQNYGQNYLASQGWTFV